LAIAGRRLIGYNMAQLYSIVTPNLTGTKLSLDSLYELALRSFRKRIEGFGQFLEMIDDYFLLLLLTPTTPLYSI
ncbi:MAG: hypothetical protein MGG37_16740, partial [Trichodesmium sp. MAG_R01]|nr:hypothetical protein [Trichodesmium sp. MAG_R01]